MTPTFSSLVRRPPNLLELALVMVTAFLFVGDCKYIVFATAILLVVVTLLGVILGRAWLGICYVASGCLFIASLLSPIDIALRHGPNWGLRFVPLVITHDLAHTSRERATMQSLIENRDYIIYECTSTALVTPRWAIVMIIR